MRQLCLSGMALSLSALPCSKSVNQLLSPLVMGDQPARLSWSRVALPTDMSSGFRLRPVLASQSSPLQSCIAYLVEYTSGLTGNPASFRTASARLAQSRWPPPLLRTDCMCPRNKSHSGNGTLRSVASALINFPSLYPPSSLKPGFSGVDSNLSCAKVSV